MKKRLWVRALLVTSSLLALGACTTPNAVSSLNSSSEAQSVSSEAPSATSEAPSSTPASSSSEAPSSSVDSLTYTPATIDDLLALTASVTDKCYEVSGILEMRSPTDLTGQAYLTDPATGKTIYVYSLTGNAKAITYQAGKFTYTAQSDAPTSLAGIANGEKVKLHALYVSYSGKAELKAVLSTHESDNTVYALTTENDGNGTLSASITSGKYDTAVTLTPTANSGFEVYNITLENAQGIKSFVTKNSDGAYVCYLTCINKVSVTFIATGYLFISLASHDFSTLPYEGGSTYGALTADTLLAAFQNASYLKSGTNVVTAASALTNVMENNAEQGPKVLGVKLGKKGGGGTFTLTLSQAVREVKLTIYGWPNDRTNVSVNGGACYDAGDSTSPVSMDFKLEASATEVTIKATLRCVITGIEFLSISKQ